MIDVNAVTIDNGKEYIIVKAIEYNGNKYVYLVNELDELDVCIRKVITENGKQYLVKLDSETELNEINNKLNEYFKANEGK